MCVRVLQVRWNNEKNQACMKSEPFQIDFLNI